MVKVKICYNVEKIKKSLETNGYYLVKLPVVDESEDWCIKKDHYYFAKSEVESAEYYHSLGTSAIFRLKDGRYVRALGPNIRTNDDSVVEINNNDWFSPRLLFDGTCIESTDIVDKWLLTHGVSQEELDSAGEEYKIYETITYEGVTTPSKKYGCWSYSSESLILDEREIEEALNSINDELLRKKIECILYARVFKRNR